MKLLLARLLRVAHGAIVLFVLTGWLLSGSLLVTHAILVPLLVLHWRTNQNRCFLTSLEHQLLGSAPDTQEPFVKSLLLRCTKKLPSDLMLEVAIYIVTISCWLLGLLKLFN